MNHRNEISQDQMLQQRKQKRGFFDSLAPTWNQTDDHNPWKKAQLKTFISSYLLPDLEAKEKAFILDLGSGTGIFLSSLEEVSGIETQVVELDLSFEMLRQGRQKKWSKPPFFVQADAHDLCFLPASFDAVVCFSAFPHFEDKRRVLAELRRLLRPRGWLYIFHLMSREKINAFHAGVNGPVNLDHLPDKQEMSLLLHEACFSAIAIDDQPSWYLARAQVPGSAAKEITRCGLSISAPISFTPLPSFEKHIERERKIYPGR